MKGMLQITIFDYDGHTVAEQFIGPLVKFSFVFCEPATLYGQAVYGVNIEPITNAKVAERIKEIREG